LAIASGGACVLVRDVQLERQQRVWVLVSQWLERIELTGRGYDSITALEGRRGPFVPEAA
jgi:hypothetical protein